MLTFETFENGVTLKTGYDTLHVSPNEEHGFRPFELMVASIIGCSTNVFKKILVKMRIDVKDMKITTNLERDEANANRIKSIHIHYVIKGGSSLSQEKVKKALSIARKNCGMIQTIEGSVNVIETFDIILD